MIQTQGLTHIHLVVRDLDRSLAFYTRVFGLEEQFREGRCMVFLHMAPGVPFVYVRDPDGYLIELLP